MEAVAARLTACSVRCHSESTLALLLSSLTTFIRTYYLGDGHAESSPSRLQLTCSGHFRQNEGQEAVFEPQLLEAIKVVDNKCSHDLRYGVFSRVKSTLRYVCGKNHHFI